MIKNVSENKWNDTLHQPGWTDSNILLSKSLGELKFAPHRAGRYIAKLRPIGAYF